MDCRGIRAPQRTDPGEIRPRAGSWACGGNGQAEQGIGKDRWRYSGQAGCREVFGKRTPGPQKKAPGFVFKLSLLKINILKKNDLQNSLGNSLERANVIGSFCPRMSYNGHKKSSRYGKNMRDIVRILFVLATVTLFLFPKVEGGAAEITLIHTGNVTGHLFPCPS